MWEIPTNEYKWSETSSYSAILQAILYIVFHIQYHVCSFWAILPYFKLSSVQDRMGTTTSEHSEHQASTPDFYFDGM